MTKWSVGIRLTLSSRGCRAVVLQAEPIVARFAVLAVVEILDVVRAARDAQNLLVIACRQRQRLRLGDRIVRLRLDDEPARRLAEIDRLDEHVRSAT